MDARKKSHTSHSRISASEEGKERTEQNRRERKGREGKGKERKIKTKKTPEYPTPRTRTRTFLPVYLEGNGGTGGISGTGGILFPPLGLDSFFLCISWALASLSACILVMACNCCAIKSEVPGLQIQFISIGQAENGGNPRVIVEYRVAGHVMSSNQVSIGNLI